MNTHFLTGPAKILLLTGMLALSPTLASAVSITSPTGSFTDNGPDINGVDIDSVPFTNASGMPLRLSGTVSASAGAVEALETLRFGFSFIEDDASVNIELEEPFDLNPNGDGGSGSGVLTDVSLPVGDTVYLVFRDSQPKANPTDILNTSYQVDVAPIPLPAGAWLLLSSGGMLWLTKRRKRSAPA